MEKNIKIGMLLDTYGRLLTDKQYQLLDDYYNNDLSLSEIAENETITRQAVRDNLKKGENNLLEYEEKLGFMKKGIKQEEIIEDIIEVIEKAESKIQEKAAITLFKSIKEKLNKIV